MVTKVLLLVSLILTFDLASTFDVIGTNVVDVCDCKEVDVVSNRDVVLRKHSDVLGRYTKIEGIQGGTRCQFHKHLCKSSKCHGMAK